MAEPLRIKEVRHMTDVMEYIPTESELKEMQVDGNPSEVVEDSYDTMALSLAGIGANVDTSDIARRRRRYPWWFRNYGAGIVYIGSQKYQVSSISRYEVRAWFIDLISLFGAYNVNVRTSPAEYQILRLAYRYSWEMFKWFRVVREKADLTYAGAMTTGNGIVLDKLLPKDLGKTDWTFTPNVGINDYVGTAGNPQTVAKASGLALFAHADDVVFQNGDSPIDQIKVNKNGIDYVTRGFEFIDADGVEDNRGVFALVPNDTLYMAVNATANSESKYHPIGVVLTPVDKAKALNIGRVF